MIHVSKNSKILLAFLFLIILVTLCVSIFGWETWSIFGVPSNNFPFGDFKIIQVSSELAAKGINPYLHNLDDIPQMNYPPIWIEISNLFNLIKHPNSLIFVSISIILYTIIYVDIIKITQSYIPILFFFSGSSLLLIERGNNDLLIIFLVYIISKDYKILTTISYCFSVVLKIYPIVIFPLIIIKNKFRIFILVPILIYLFYIQDSLSIFLKNTPKSASTSYGTNTMSIILERYLDVEINFIVISILFLILTASFYKFFFENHIRESNEKTQNLFIYGSSILCFTFLITSNWDYRLSFLILCVPYILLQKKNVYLCFIISSVIAMHFNILFLLFGKIGALINLLSKITLFTMLFSFTYHIILEKFTKLFK